MRWCAGVGPPLVLRNIAKDELPSNTLTLVSWNTHVGGGDVSALVADLMAGRLTNHRPVMKFVLILQEVYRAGHGVPSRPPEGAKGAGAVHGAPSGTPGRDIEAIADTLGLDLFYVPSMRNGGAAETGEDRGNAILSTEPLTDYTAIELPLERQRRVALAATVTTTAADGRPYALRVASVHLTNMVAHHGWILSEAGRVRQARALAPALDAPSIVVGGDFNTWFGTSDGAYREIGRHVPPAPEADRRPTFMFMRLDHFFRRLPEGSAFRVRRADDRYGSDHYPLIADLSIGR